MGDNVIPYRRYLRQLKTIRAIQEQMPPTPGRH